MYRMVIVDDDEIEREGMTNFIPWEKYGIEIVGSAWNGQEGYEVISARKPDLVITDIKMPVMNGIELIRRVREENEEVLFVVLSGYGEYEYTSQAMELGIRHYVLKPCDEKRIVAVLEQAKKELEEARKKNALLEQAMDRLKQEYEPLDRQMDQKISQEELLEICREIRHAADLQTLLLQISVLYAWLRICRYSEEEIRSVGRWLVNALEDKKGSEAGDGSQQVVSRCAVAAMQRSGRLKLSREESRMRDILIAVYSSIGDRDLGLHWLASEVIFMNEEYLGRLFARNMNRKFSDFVSETRIEIAKRLLEHSPGLHIADLAECVGYSEDGQYFSRMFKKYTGKTPSDYREYILKNGEMGDG